MGAAESTGTFLIWQLPDDIFCRAALLPRSPRLWGFNRYSGRKPSARRSTGEPVWRHALSMFGDVKYPADFKRFDYVNPDAPKGGVGAPDRLGTFDNFNMVVQGVKGSIAGGVALIYETLTTRSQDEASTAYGLLAEAAAYPDDFSYVIYRLRRGALARRQAGDAGRCDLLIRCVQEKQSDVQRLLPSRRQVRKGRRA